MAGSDWPPRRMRASSGRGRSTRFYNLLLAVGVAIGLGLVASGNGDAGRALVLSACGSMVAAGAVLVLHDARFIRAAAVQLVRPLVAILVVLSSADRSVRPD